MSRYGKWYTDIAHVWHMTRSLTHWGRVTHTCVSKLTIIDSENGLSPDRHQAIIWTNAGLLLIGPLGTNFSEILIEILTFSFKKMRLKVSFAKRRPFCLGLSVLKLYCYLLAWTVAAHCDIYFIDLNINVHGILVYSPPIDAIWCQRNGSSSVL